MSDAEGSGESPPDRHGALRGWRVLEVATNTAACFCGRILADLGADVVMIEPAAGHERRSDEPRGADGLSYRFVYLSAGKRSVALGDDGDARLRRLISEADVLVTDHPPEDVETWLTESEQIAVVSVRPFGTTGPGANRHAHHLTVFHASGESSTLPSGLGWELFPERPPLQLGSDVAHFDAGWNAALAVMAACYEMGTGRVPQQADVSVQESELTLNRTRLNRWNNDGVCVGRERSRYGITGMMLCRDGWAQVVGMRDEHWDRLAEAPSGAAFKEAGLDTKEGRDDNQSGLGTVFKEWCAGRVKADVVSVLSGIGVPAGIFAEPVDLLNSDQLEYRGFFRDVETENGSVVRLPGAPYQFSRTPWQVGSSPALGTSAGFGSRTTPAALDRETKGRLLEGVRVLDFTWAAAGPYATLLLGFLGAEIVKVESRRKPDPARRGFIAFSDGLDGSPIFNELNLNKKSLLVDLTQAEGLAAVKGLVGRFDVVVDNFRPGVMDRFGLGATDLLSAHPHLIVASSSANGSRGPDAMGAGLASIFAASGGLSIQTGYGDGPPTEVTDPVDYRSGAVLAVGIVAALIERSRSGLGQSVDVSSREVVATSAPDALLAHAAGVNWDPRIGNSHRTMSPHDVYPCRDGGWVAVAVGREDEWASLCRLLDRAEWIEGFSTPGSRRAQESLIADKISGWTRSLSVSGAADALQSAGIPASAVMTFAALSTDPHLVANRVFTDVEHPELGRQRVMRPPWRFSDSGPGVLTAGPLLGADNDDVLYGVEEVSRLSPERRRQVFG